MKLRRLLAITFFGFLLHGAACVDVEDPTDSAARLAEDERAEADPLDEAPSLDDGDQVLIPAPPPPGQPPRCFNGNAAGGQMKGVGWTCEINPNGSNLCCDVNLGLTCDRVPNRPPFGTECRPINPPNPNPNPNPWPNPSPSPSPNPNPNPSPGPSPSPSPAT